MEYFYKNRIAMSVLYHLIPVLVFLTDPFDMSVNQRIVLSALLLTIIWWTSGFVPRNIACVFLLTVFLVFGNSSPYDVFKFALTPSFYLIMLSFLLSTGISNSKAADRIASMVLKRYGKTPVKLVLLSFVFGTALIFIIPQTFSRVILLSSIYGVFLKNRIDNAETKEVILFSIFVSSATTSMLLLNGDIVLNYSAIEFAGLQAVASHWLKAMFVPSLIVNIIVFYAFIFVFKQKLDTKFFKANAEPDLYEAGKAKVSRKEISAVIIMIVVVLLWLTETLHGVNTAIVALLGVIAMLGTGVLSFRDLKTVNFDLLIFLTTVFAIGTVMQKSGVSSMIFSNITSIMPGSGSVVYLLSMAIIVMVLHMFVGSCIATLSVVIPSMVQMAGGTINRIVIALLCFVMVNIHFLFPFQHVTVMIGAAKKAYSDKIVLRFGLVLTVISLFSLLCLYIPWWKAIGLL
jgi:sodium-dependent dicarboxylate transporter 2/3/5